MAMISQAATSLTIMMRLVTIATRKDVLERIGKVPRKIQYRRRMS
jgi:hypothetical protein